MTKELRTFFDKEPIYWPEEPQDDPRWLKAMLMVDKEVTSDQIHQSEELIMLMPEVREENGFKDE